MPAAGSRGGHAESKMPYTRYNSGSLRGAQQLTGPDSCSRRCQHCCRGPFPSSPLLPRPATASVLDTCPRSLHPQPRPLRPCPKRWESRSSKYQSHAKADQVPVLSACMQTINLKPGYLFASVPRFEGARHALHHCSYRYAGAALWELLLLGGEIRGERASAARIDAARGCMGSDGSSSCFFRVPADLPIDLPLQVV